MANLYNVPLENSVQLTLQNALLTGETSTITFTSSVAAKLQASATMKGILVIDRVDANGTETPTKTEYISFTAVSGSTVTGLTRGVATTTNQDHSAGAIAELVPDITWAQAINDVFITQHNSDGTHKSNVLTSLISNATQGDLIVFNAGAFTRLATASLNNILAVTSTASGLLPGYITAQSTASYFVSNTSTTTVTPNAFTEMTNSSVTLILNQTSHIKYNYSFLMQNNTANRFWSTSIYKDASAVKNNNHQGFAAGTGTTFNGLYLEKNVPAGTYSYKLYIKNSTTSDSLTYSSAGSDIIVEVIPA